MHVLPSIFRALDSRRLFRSASRRQSKEAFLAKKMNLFTNSMDSVIFAVLVFALSKHSAVRNIWNFGCVTSSHACFDVFVVPKAGLLTSCYEHAVRVFHLEAFIAAEYNDVPSFESIDRAIKRNFCFSDPLGFYLFNLQF